MAEIFCDSDSVKLKAGTTATALSAAQYTELINQAESLINTICKFNFSDTYSSLNDDVKKILEDAASSHAAMSAICWDLDAYTSTNKIQTLLDVNAWRFDQAIKRLKDKEYTDFISGA